MVCDGASRRYRASMNYAAPSGERERLRTTLSDNVIRCVFASRLGPKGVEADVTANAAAMRGYCAHH